MISVIGAGPIGGYAAHLLAQDGFDVHLYEEHKAVGEPVQCTGIVTDSLLDVIKLPKKYIINRFANVDVYVDTIKEPLTLPITDFIVNRTDFDQYLVDQAVKSGATLHTGSKFVGIEQGKIVIQQGEKTLKKRTRTLIGADGPNSPVQKLIDNQQRENFIGAQATVKGDFNKLHYGVYLGESIPGFFGWVVPENEGTARIGLAVKNNPKECFDKFLARLGFSKDDCTCYQGGLIPIYNPKLKTSAEKEGIKMFSVGDAAGMVKATTGGGIVYGLQACHALRDSIIKHKNYEKEWKKLIQRKLQLHLKIRKTLDKFSNQDYEKLISMLNKEDIRFLFGRYNRDNPVQLATSLLRKEPRLLGFAKKVF